MGTSLVGAADDRLDVLDLPGLEQHVAHRDEQRPLVDPLEDLGVVVADDHLELRLGLVEVADGGEVPALVDDSVAGGSTGRKQESATASAIATFWCITVEPGGAPMILATWSPTVHGVAHHPSAQERSRAPPTCARTRRAGRPSAASRPASGSPGTSYARGSGTRPGTRGGRAWRESARDGRVGRRLRRDVPAHLRPVRGRGAHASGGARSGGSRRGRAGAEFSTARAGSAGTPSCCRARVTASPASIARRPCWPRRSGGEATPSGPASSAATTASCHSGRELRHRLQPVLRARLPRARRGRRRPP